MFVTENFRSQSGSLFVTENFWSHLNNFGIKYAKFGVFANPDCADNLLLSVL